MKANFLTSFVLFTLKMVELVKSRSHESGSMNNTKKNGIIKVQKGPKGRKKRRESLCALRDRRKGPSRMEH